MHFEYDAVWHDVRRLWAAHRDHLLPILGVFVFLPTLAIGLFLAPAKEITPDLNGLQAAMDYVRANFLPLMAVRLMALIGVGAMFSVLLRQEAQTVGKAISTTLALLPGLFLLNVLIRMSLGAGLFMFIIPAIYIAARTFLAPAAMMAEHLHNPLRAFGRGFDLSSGNGWRIVGIGAIILLVMMLAVEVFSILFRIAGTLLLDESGVKIVTAVLGGVGEMVFELILTLLAAALYRQLSGAKNGI
jgi:hypothetical protein